MTAGDRAAHVEREAVAVAIDYLSRATGGIQSDATDAAATLVNVGDLRRVLRVLAALPQTGDAVALAAVGAIVGRRGATIDRLHAEAADAAADAERRNAGMREVALFRAANAKAVAGDVGAAMLAELRAALTAGADQ